MSKHLKESDVFENTTFLFGRKAAFDEAFPQVDDFKIAVTERGSGVRLECYERTYSKNTAGEHVKCTNSTCFNGGVRIGPLLRSMVEQRKNSDSITQDCQGYEGSPKGRRRYGPCDHEFDIRIDVIYKADS